MNLSSASEPSPPLASLFSSAGSSDHPSSQASTPPSPSRRAARKTLTLKTDRAGRHHIIRAAVIGPNGHTQLVHRSSSDTGATDMVLPASMIAKLGFRESYESSSRSASRPPTASPRACVVSCSSLELGGPDHNDVLQRVPVMFMSDDDTAATRSWA